MRLSIEQFLFFGPVTFAWETIGAVEAAAAAAAVAKLSSLLTGKKIAGLRFEWRHCKKCYWQLHAFRGPAKKIILVISACFCTFFV